MFSTFSRAPLVNVCRCFVAKEYNLKFSKVPYPFQKIFIIRMSQVCLLQNGEGFPVRDERVGCIEVLVPKILMSNSSPKLANKFGSSIFP